MTATPYSGCVPSDLKPVRFSNFWIAWCKLYDPNRPEREAARKVYGTRVPQLPRASAIFQIEEPSPSLPCEAIRHSTALSRRRASTARSVTATRRSVLSASSRSAQRRRVPEFAERMDGVRPCFLKLTLHETINIPLLLQLFDIWGHYILPKSIVDHLDGRQHTYE